MTARIFVVIATLIVGVLSAVGLVVFEHVPDPVRDKKEYQVEDPFMDMRFVAGTRRSNLSAFGIPDKLIAQIEDRIVQIQRRDQKGELLVAMKGAPDVAGVLCSNAPPLPSRYAVVGILLNGERGRRRSVIPFDRHRNRIAFQEGYAPTDLELMYKATELIPNAPIDAYVLNLSALLLGQEIERVEQDGMWGGGLFGPPSFVSVLNRTVEIEADLVELLAQTFYMHEVARDPKSEFCGVRVGATFSDGAAQ
jgi:hypothetical protein